MILILFRTSLAPQVWRQVGPTLKSQRWSLWDKILVGRVDRCKPNVSMISERRWADPLDGCSSCVSLGSWLVRPIRRPSCSNFSQRSITLRRCALRHWQHVKLSEWPVLLSSREKTALEFSRPRCQNLWSYGRRSWVALARSHSQQDAADFTKM